MFLKLTRDTESGYGADDEEPNVRPTNTDCVRKGADQDANDNGSHNRRCIGQDYLTLGKSKATTSRIVASVPRSAQLADFVFAHGKQVASKVSHAADTRRRGCLQALWLFYGGHQGRDREPHYEAHQER